MIPVRPLLGMVGGAPVSGGNFVRRLPRLVQCEALLVPLVEDFSPDFPFVEVGFSPLGESAGWLPAFCLGENMKSCSMLVNLSQSTWVWKARTVGIGMEGRVQSQDSSSSCSHVCKNAARSSAGSCSVNSWTRVSMRDVMNMSSDSAMSSSMVKTTGWKSTADSESGGT